jgi:hypothetical protein
MIPVNSTNASAREQPFFMPQISNLPHGKTGIVWNDVGGGITDRVRYRLTGGAYTNGKIANIVEKGYGIYAYRHEQTDTVTKGFIYLDADDPDCQSWTGQEQIAAQLGGILVGETDDVERELAFHLPNTVNPMTPTLGQSFSTGQVKLFLPGGVGWVDADVSRVVEKGEGDYALRLTDAQVVLAGKIYLYVNCPGSQPWVWWYDIVDSGLGAGAIELISITQPPLERWKPVVAVVRLSGASAFVKYRAHALYLGIYDPTLGFTSNFKERSSIQVDGDIVTFTILPNGGWWTNTIRLKFAAGAELAA